MTTKSIDPLYPDILRAMTGGFCVTMPKLQVAFAVSPHQLYLNQPAELIVLLQSTMAESMGVVIGVQPPTRSDKNRLVLVQIAQKIIQVNLGGGEVSALHIPFVVLPPTPANLPLEWRIALRYNAAQTRRFVRQPIGGEQPSLLTRSTLRFQVLSQIDFTQGTWDSKKQAVKLKAQLMSHRLFPPQRQSLAHRLVSLWTPDALQEERDLINSATPDAERVADALRFKLVLDPLVWTVEEWFAKAEIPLHPAEARAIARLLAYALDGAYTRLEREDTRWFQMLCQAMAHDSSLIRAHPGDIVSQYLMPGLLYDAVLLGFRLLAPLLNEDLGDQQERVNYAHRLLLALGGDLEPDISFAYLPLVMAGLLVHERVSPPPEKTIFFLFDLREALAGRKTLLDGIGDGILFRLTDDLLERAQQRFQSNSGSR